MDLHVDWFEKEKMGVHVLLPGTYTWAELFHAVDTAMTLADSVDYPVYVMVDMRQSQYLPPLTLQNLRRIAHLPPGPNCTAVFVLGAQRYILATFEIYRRIFPEATHWYRFVATLDEFLELRQTYEKAQ